MGEGIKIKGMIISSNLFMLKPKLYGVQVLPGLWVRCGKIPYLDTKKNIKEYGVLPYSWKHIHFQLKWIVWDYDLFIRWSFKMPLPGREKSWKKA